MTERSTPPRRPSGRTAARPWLVALLVVLSAAHAPPMRGGIPEASDVGGGPAVGRAAAPVTQKAEYPSNDDPLAEAVVLPPAHYRHAEAHANDEIAFKPGARVSVPFRPRTDDHWQVDGRSPIALPAGYASGGQIREAGPESLWSGGTPGDLVRAAPGSGASVDLPAGSSVAADLASVRPDLDDAAVGSTAVVGPSGLRREVFGFLPYWQLTDTSTVLDWETLSTVAYFSVGCTSSGGLRKSDADGSVSTGWAGWTSARMTSVINRAHEHGARVVLTLTCFAWSNAGASAQASVLGNRTARATLARRVAAAVRDRGADGVNLDFEPILPGYADEFTALVRAVRLELDAIAPGYQLTFDAMATIGNQPIAEATAPGGADAVIIMGYDYRTAASSVAGSISPLSGPTYNLTDTVRAFTARVPASKVILAVPYYGRAWSTATNDLHATTLNPNRYGAAAEPYYTEAADLAAAHGHRYDRLEQSPWAAYRREICTDAHGCVTTWRQMYYDDAESLKLRYDLVNSAGLRGAGIWALGFDGRRPELREALADRFLSDLTPPVVGNTGSQEGRVPESLAVGGYGRVIVDGLRLRSSPSTSAEIMTFLRVGTSLRLIGGPVRHDGYTWFHVSRPVRHGMPPDPRRAGGWVAAYGSGVRHVVPRRTPYAIRVSAAVGTGSSTDLGLSGTTWRCPTWTPTGSGAAGEAATSGCSTGSMALAPMPQAILDAVRKALEILR